MSGKVVHFEIPIDDPDRAVAFYAQALGWSLDRWGRPLLGVPRSQRIRDHVGGTANLADQGGERP